MLYGLCSWLECGGAFKERLHLERGANNKAKCGIVEVEVVNNHGIVYNQSLTRMTGPMEKGNYLPTHIIVPIARIG